MAPSLTAVQVRRARFASLSLSSPRHSSARAAVDHLGALQGQDLPGVLWSLAARVPGSTFSTVRDEFTAGRLIRGWPMRGTLHIIRPQDLSAFTSLTAGRMIRSMAATDSHLGLTPQVIARATERVMHELEHNGPIDRAALRTIITDSGISPEPAQRVNHVVYHLAVRGHICLGPFRGDTQLFVASHLWCDRAEDDDADAALRRLLLHYVTGHGPVSDIDAARWFGLPLTPIRAALTELRDVLVAVGTPTGNQWMAASDATDDILLSNDRPPPVRLLAGFDEYMLGYADRSFAVPVDHLQDIVPGNNGMFRATLTVGGRVAGIWTKQNSGRVLSIEPFAGLSDATSRAIDREARRYASATGRDVEARISLRG